MANLSEAIISHVPVSEVDDPGSDPQQRAAAADQKGAVDRSYAVDAVLAAEVVLGQLL